MDAAIRIAIELVEPEERAGGLLGLARLAVLEDQPEGAAHLLGAADAVLEDAGIELERFDVDERGRTVEMTTQRLGSDRYEQLYGEGRALSITMPDRRARPLVRPKLAATVGR